MYHPADSRLYHPGWWRNCAAGAAKTFLRAQAACDFTPRCAIRSAGVVRANVGVRVRETRADARTRSAKSEGSDMRYLHTMVRVADLDAALDFYCAKLGLAEIRRIENEKGRFTLVFLAAPEDAERAARESAPMVELTYNWDSENYTGGRNFGHLAYRVNNIYETCANLMDGGVTAAYWFGELAPK